MISENKKLELAQKYGYKNISVPVISYIKWVVKRSVELSIDTLYFLARDGYLLKIVAEEICKVNNINIKCKYLYCSRYSLRMASYHFLKEEKYDLLFGSSQNVSVSSLLDRVGMEEEIQSEIYKELGIEEPQKRITNKELYEVSQMLKKSVLFNQYLDEKSYKSYKLTVKYFEQEGIFNQNIFCIVDSGWVGSMQRSLRQIIQENAHFIKIHGFYFGMFDIPKSKEDGIYETFYFSRDSFLLRKIMFSNNLFECMLSAPHGMTIGYYEKNQRIKPLLKETPNSNMINLINNQIRGVIRFMKANRSYLMINDKHQDKESNSVYKILKKAMVYPSKEDLNFLKNFLFCDDVSDICQYSIAETSDEKDLKEYILINRIIRKVLKNKNHNSLKNTNTLYWPYALVTTLPKYKQIWYRLNIFLGEGLRYIIKKWRH